MNLTKTSLLLLLATAALPMGAQIHKMERSDTVAHSYNLNPVVVTGSGHHQRLKSTATPVHVLSAQEMKEQGITTLDAALMRMMPQISMAPNSMGSQLRLNGLGNKYILILVNGQKLSGDISNNVDLNRINMARVKRIEVLDGAASSLYGSDAIAGVINIITDNPTVAHASQRGNTDNPVVAHASQRGSNDDSTAVGHASQRGNTDNPVVAHASQRGSNDDSTAVAHASQRGNTDNPTLGSVGYYGVASDTRISGHGIFTENATLDIYKGGFGSYTSFSHDRADSYRNNPLEYVKGSDTETQPSIAPLFTGYRASLVGQKFTYSPDEHLALNAGLDYSYKITDRPNTATVPDGSPSGTVAPTGGTDYEMRYKGLRWNVGGIYKFTQRNSLQADFTVDRFRYGKEYDVGSDGLPVGTYIQSKKQRTMEGSVKAILDLFGSNPRLHRRLPRREAWATTIVGADWRKDFLTATSGNIDQSVYTLAAYAQHEQPFRVGRGSVTATLGLRLNHHETFGNHFTPKATIMYSLGPVNIRATYSAGFRAPGLDELYYHYFSVNRGKAQISFGNRNLSPEKSHYVSLNAEYRTQTFAVSLTGFLNRINDMVVKQNIPVDDDTRQMLLTEFPEMTQDQADKMVSYALYQNSDKGDVKGVQANLSANLFPGFNLSANYAYTYARTMSVPSPSVASGGSPAESATWQPLDRSIRHAATLAANWHHAWGKTYALNVNLNARFQSKTYYAAPYENAPGFGIWNLHTIHTFNAIRWAVIEPSIGIENLFDRVDRRIDSSYRKYALYSPGRMLVAGLKIRFN